MLRVRYGRTGKRYGAAAALIAAGYLAFFTSSLWYPDQKALEYSPMGYYGSGEAWGVTLVNWEYAPGAKEMAVELDLEGIAEDEVAFSAVAKKGDSLEAGLVLSGNGTCIVRIGGVPEEFEAVSFRITEEANGETLRLYTNEEQAKRVEQIQFYGTIEEYYRDRAERNIRDMEAEMAAIEDEIANRREEMAACRRQMTQAGERLPYLSASQREDTREAIAGWQRQTEQMEQEQEDAEGRIRQLQQEVAEQRQRLEEMEKGDAE